MLKNLLIAGLRNILRDKTYSLINIFGLILGFTCSLFLLLYIVDELSYDKFHKNHPNIYRVVSNITEPDDEFTWAVVQIPFAEEVKANYEEVVNSVRFFNAGRGLMKFEEKSFFEENLFFADSTVFDIFTFPFLAGDPETALDEPNAIVVSESMAIRYFGSIDCLGKSLRDTQDRDLKITGIVKDVPENSHLQFDGLISAGTIENMGTSWGSFGVYTYVQLTDGYDPLIFTSKLDAILEEHVKPIFEEVGISIEYELQPIARIHLHSKIQDEAEAGGDISYIYIFGIVAAFMLIIACINYMNLATARASQRSREVGIRKVMGSLRSQLIYQFIGESFIMASVALLISAGLIYLLLPSFNQLANKNMEVAFLFQPIILVSGICILLFVGIVGGSYPAFFLSGFKPVAVLKGKGLSGKGSSRIRKGLVIFQFFISVFMIISTLIVFKQLNYMQDKDLGWNRKQVVRMALTTSELREHYTLLKNELLQLAEVDQIGTATTSPGYNVGKQIMDVENNDGELVNRGVDQYFCDYDYFKSLKMKIKEGREFSLDYPADTLYSVIVNEAMVDRMGWDNPIGKRFVMQTRDSTLTSRVIGVLSDYHQNSLYEEIEPLLIRYRRANHFVFVKMDVSDVKASIAKIESVWSSVNPDFPFSYEFLDDDFNSQYDADKRRGEIFMLFSIITIAIACLGLLGLISYSTEQRRKEIGIRKVVGASTLNLFYLLSKEFVLLILVASILAFPIAWYFMENWLNTFAYKINLSDQTGMFLIAAISAFIISMITVSYHTLRAANSNPVNSLREE